MEPAKIPSELSKWDGQRYGREDRRHEGTHTEDLAQWVEANREYFELLIETPELTLTQIAEMIGSRYRPVYRYVSRHYWEVHEARHAWRYKFDSPRSHATMRPKQTTVEIVAQLRVLLADPLCTLQEAADELGITRQWAHHLALRYFRQEYKKQRRHRGGGRRRPLLGPPVPEPIVEPPPVDLQSCVKEGELPPGVVRLSDYLL